MGGEKDLREFLPLTPAVLEDLACLGRGGPARLRHNEGGRAAYRRGDALGTGHALPLGGAAASEGLDPGIGRAARPGARRRAPPLLPADRPGTQGGSRRGRAPGRAGAHGPSEGTCARPATADGPGGGVVAPPQGPHGPAVSVSERLYRALLAAYPKEFRQAHGREMAQVFRCMCREEIVRDGRGGLAG